MNREPEGISTRSLLGAFFAVVVLCAVFFSLGFFLGYRQSHPASNLTTEQVPAGSDLPAAVNVPESSAPSSSSAPSTPAATYPATSDSQPPESDGATDQPAASSSAPVDKEANSRPAAADQETAGSISTSHLPAGLLVQVAAVTNQQDAANVVKVLKSKNYPALILTPAQAKADDNFYRVVAGPYRSRTDAERVRKELTSEGFKPFIR
jgi:cell division septation protein DedD